MRTLAENRNLLAAAAVGIGVFVLKFAFPGAQLVASALPCAIGIALVYLLWRGDVARGEKSLAVADELPMDGPTLMHRLENRPLPQLSVRP